LTLAMDADEYAFLLSPSQKTVPILTLKSLSVSRVKEVQY